MNNNTIYIREKFTQEELKVIKGSLLTTKETFKLIPFKNNDIKEKIKQIDTILNKFLEGS